MCERRGLEGGNSIKIRVGPLTLNFISISRVRAPDSQSISLKLSFSWKMFPILASKSDCESSAATKTEKRGRKPVATNFLAFSLVLVALTITSSHHHHGFPEALAGKRLVQLACAGGGGREAI